MLKCRAKRSYYLIAETKVASSRQAFKRSAIEAKFVKKFQPTIWVESTFAYQSGIAARKGLLGYNYFIYKNFLPTLPHHRYRHFAPAILTYLLLCLSIITQILYFVLPVPKQILLNFNFTASGRFAWRSQFVLLCNAFKLL